MRKATLAALLFLFVMSLVLTYPLAFHLAGAVEDRQDALLNVWITAWDGHQLLSDPLHLFDANIFYPYPRTLAYSELLLGNALLALPLTAATGNPVLGYNAALLLSFVLSGLGTYLLVVLLTRSPGAGLVAGLIFAFSSYRLSNLAQAQLLTTQWIPFALLSLCLLIRRPRLRHAATFVVFFCLQTLSSFYYGILLALACVGLVVLSGFGIWSQPGESAPIARLRSAMPYLLLAACACMAILLPFILPYLHVQRELGFVRSLGDSEPFSASLRQYLMVPPGSVVYGRWLPSDDVLRAGGYPVDALFPGLATAGLALWGLIRGRGRMRWAFFLILLASVCLSLGPRLYLAPGQSAGLDISLPYAWLYAVVPGFNALRAPARFNALVMLSVAVLAGYGVAALSASVYSSRPTSVSSTRRRQAGIVALVAALVVLESWVVPAARAEPVPVGDGVPPVYHWLAGQARAPLLELPMAFTPDGPQLENQYLSTIHWQTTPDGYSGFIPPQHGQIVYEMDRFPSERSISLLQALGVRYLVLHTDRLPPARRQEIQAALPQAAEMALLRTFGADQVYQLQGRSFEPGELEVRGYLPPRAVAGQPYTAYIIAVNRGQRSYAVSPTDLLRPTAVWQDGTEETRSRVQANLPLVTSPEGGVAVIPVPLTAPAQAGSYRLTLGESDGPLGEWGVEGSVTVGTQGDDAFPVPAQLVRWTIPAAVRAGRPLSIDLTWRALGKIDAYYSVYVKLLDAAGNAVAGWDGQPRNGEAPTLLWVPGDPIVDRVTLIIPPETPPGDYTVEVGMYRADDLARALSIGAQGAPVDRVVLGTVHVDP